MQVFEHIGGTEALAKWAREHPTEFYKICARLIPHEGTGPGDDGEHRVTTIVHQLICEHDQDANRNSVVLSTPQNSK